MTGWTREQYAWFSRMFFLCSAGPAFLWIMTDSWFAGATLVTGLVCSYWAKIDAERIKEGEKTSNAER